MSNYKELKVWQQAMDLVMDIYILTRDFPNDERFGLTSQMRRSSVSIPSNIAEGSGRDTKGNFSNFLNFAKGSTCELETQILIACKLGYISQEKTENLTNSTAHIERMLYKLIRSLG